MTFRVGCELQYRVLTPVSFIWNVAVRPCASQTVSDESLTFSVPGLEPEYFLSPNRCHRVLAIPGDLTLHYSATVAVQSTLLPPSEVGQTPVEQLPPAVLPYVLPSRYCQSDKLSRLAYREFGFYPPGHTRVQAICNWIFTHIEYLRGSTNEHTSAGDTLTERAGVCRDFAHLGIALCRASEIPARFVSAYAWHLDPPDFHAVFEAYLNGQWFLFDATRQVPLTGIVRIGTGRDAADASFATLFGNAQMPSMNITMESTTGDPQHTSQALTLGD